MTDQELLKTVDHTLLKPTATWAEIKKLCEEAIAYQTASVCIPPAWVKQAKAVFPDLTVCTVIGFPLGYNTTNIKAMETREAIENGASEIDMVINQGWVKQGDFESVRKEIEEIKRACNGRLLKVIVESCNLNDEELVELCHCVTDSGADFIKTSTGFAKAGASHHAVEVMAREVGPQVRIKASGGIHTREEMELYLKLGCSRIGASGAIKAVKG